ncbi:MAG: site-specific DNA-methyltransferase [Thalassospira sp.]|jgi:DNA modification methylase|uniref:DNA-methyltransferase n=1 Tax=unclassified Thalassospira TaxID=2648997 RepID=UPI000D75EEBD|nr:MULTISPECIES: site-specific DNA-methyltransferase [unclassified Thalassospira]MBL4839371.1 site-specific DNA-methyltransferase [Thalassospira sp.]PXX36257.1 DNA modification methylase [Thalassospira sp. 11-3]QPL37460.1 site-specific DNA-methyltransferase [Thalassospira sp. B30-1]
MTVEILIGDCRALLAELPDQSVHTCVTSPPYFGLRDYGCDGQIGLEATPAEFLAAMVEVFRDVRRVLRDDGTVWINIGDSYAGGGRGGSPGHSPHIKQKSNSGSLSVRGVKRDAENFKPKDLMGIPWRLALALQDDGWYLRQDIIWSKPNPMPESVTDRCTKSHEYIFLLTKQDRYHFDHEAIKDDANLTGKGNAASFRGGAYVGGATFDNTNGGKRNVSGNVQPRGSRDSFKREGSKRGVSHVGQNMGTHRPDRDDGQWDIAKRNKRSVWTVATQGFKEAHFATYPPALIEPCILAGCPEGGTVLDPFGGAGTTGLVADRLKRNAIMIELNPEYAEIARKRIEGDARLFSNVTVSDPLAGAA